MRHVRKYQRQTCGTWRVIDGRRRMCTFAKGHEGDHEWQSRYADLLALEDGIGWIDDPTDDRAADR